MPSVKNTAKGPRGIRTASGDLVMIEAGQSAEGDFPAAEVKDFKAALAFEAGEAPAPEPDEPGEKPLAKMNKTELLEAAAAAGVSAAADDEGKEVALDQATNKQLVAAIEKAQAEK
jgi:hypothetical protein